MTRKRSVFTLVILSVFPAVIFGITTIHHDKPERSHISEMATKMVQETGRKVTANATGLYPERQKRLLPYINYYLNQNQQAPDQQRRAKLIQPSPESIQQHEKFTPFLESNALPGPFTPILKSTTKNNDIEYVTPTPQIEKNPDYSVIYDTLLQLKQAQQITRPPILDNPVYSEPQVNYLPMHYYNNQRQNLQTNVQTAKTVIETYTPTNIDISEGRKNYENIPLTAKNYNEHLVYKIYRTKPQMDESYEVQDPLFNYRTQNYDKITVTTAKPYYEEKLIFRKPILVYQQKGLDNDIPKHHEKEYAQQEKPVLYTIQTTTKPAINTIIDEEYVAQKFTPISPSQGAHYENVQMRQYIPVQFITHKEQEYYTTPVPEYTTPVPEAVHEEKPTENTNLLGKILKQLQNSNDLPQTITAENIDNSIRTLVKILNGLRKQQGLKLRPIVVADENSEEKEEDEKSSGEIIEEPNYVPGTITQTFPANTIEGGTPGRPGIDYPALSSIPQTSFNCKTQRYKGFFGDPNTNCQVWHYCDLNGGQASFLCPNGTIFSQVALTCDWWYNVKCSSTPQLYVLNERLYKYILPLAPKFPEDYSGPLVDRYLTLKFKEMEEKMKKEKKKEETSEEEKSEEKDDSDQLQDIQNEKAKSSEET